MLILAYGDSMKPALKILNLVSIKPLKTKEEKAKLKVNDIIFYVSKGYNRHGKPLGHKEMVLHRIIDFDSKGKIEVKGDNRSYTERIDYEDVKGVLEKVIL